MSLRVRRHLTLVVFTVALALVAPPAWADPPGPTNYRSEVTSLTGAADGLSARIEGGDSFLVLSVEQGREVVVPGYDEEEVYLRFAPDGAVFENRNSATYYQNLDRYGASVPDDAGVGAEPDFVQVADGGTYAWHDHRVHWMSPSPPDRIDTGVSEAQRVFEWEIPLEVDREPATISGTLTWLPPTTPVLPIVVAVVALAGGLFLAARRDDAAPWVALGAGVGTAVVAASLRIGLEPGMDPNGVLLPLTAIAVGGPALAARAKGHAEGERAAFVGAGAASAVAAVAILGGAFTNPVLPGALPDDVLRLLLAATAGIAAAALITIVRGLIPSLPDLDEP